MPDPADPWTEKEVHAKVLWFQKPIGDALKCAACRLPPRIDRQIRTMRQYPSHLPSCALRLLAALRAISVCGAVSVCGATGCSHADRMRPTIEAYSRGAYAKAASTYEPLLKDRRKSNKDRLLYELEAGSIDRALGAEAHSPEVDAQSMAAFGFADEETWQYLDSEPDIRISEQAAAILTNQTVITYRATTYDRIMCSTYQALNHLDRGDLASAGVSLRRAYEWQRDAVAKYAKEIEGLEAKADEAAREKNYDAKAAMNDPRTKSGLDSAYGAIRDMTGYAEFAVPYSTYLQSLQQMLTGRSDDAAQATVGFRKVAGMLRESDRTYVLEDARAGEDASIGKRPPPMVYILVESGMGPALEEFKISIPLFIRQVPYVGASFPVLKFKPGGPSGFTARAGSASYASTQLTDMDAVIAGDFNRRLPAIIALTLISSASKAVGTYFLQEAALNRNKETAWLVSIAGAIYQVATNSADLRIWLTLPKEVLYARFPAPADGMISLDLGDGQRIGPIAVESNGSTVVHIRVPSSGATPALRTMRFPVH